MEISGEELKALNEEALSINEECQSTNEELLTSKEELQSLNEELTALNSQLQETLERQRTTSNDLQNVLYSTDVATLFLDSDLNIRFFTPATKSLFNVIPSDIGRPLADLNSLATDADLLEDARTVLKSLSAMEREVEGRSGVCFVRRILPYRTHNDGVEGVVITFTDITERKQIAKALEAAKLEAELATATKSRFLASASHDLRQPLQTLKLLQGLLVETIEDEPSQKLTKRIGDTIGAMAGMLNALLDINQIETGAVQAHPVSFRIGDLIERMREEFGYHAASQGLALRVIPCSAIVVSDPRLLEQMVRNLLSNAFKYTKRGRVLLGCRRHGDKISIEVWDTGAGIPDSQLQAIFDEYHQLDNPARERSLGLGLGLSIVQRLGGLLKHEIRVKSTLRKGSVFSIDVGLAPADSPLEEVSADLLEPHEKHIHNGMILIVEDDPELGDLLGSLLTIEGYHTSVARDGVEALARVAQGGVQPDLILADYNLPKGLTGLEVVIKLRENLRRKIPAIILTGDIATRTSREVALQDCTQLNKPVKLKEVVHTIERLLPPTRPPKVGASLDSAISWSELSAPVVFVVDDDNMLRDTMRIVLEADGHIVEDFASCEAFLESYAPNGPACLLLDATLPGMKGIELIQHLREKGDVIPAIMITGQSEVSLAVEAMKAGASDFIQKPFERSELLESVTRAIENSRDTSKLEAWRQSAADHISELTPRQHEIMNRVLAGQPSKIIAADLGISQRTVENHRASIMKRTESKSIPALARLALAAAKGKTIETPFSPEADSPKAA
jgi:two-component system CheB/CheR fusion protein